MSMTCDEMTAAGIPAEHHELCIAAMGAGFDIGTILALLAKYGPAVWTVIQELLTFAKDPHTGVDWLAEVVKVIGMLTSGGSAPAPA